MPKNCQCSSQGQGLDLRGQCRTFEVKAGPSRSRSGPWRPRPKILSSGSLEAKDYITMNSTKESGGEALFVSVEAGFLRHVVASDAVDELVASQSAVHEQRRLPRQMNDRWIFAYQLQLETSRSTGHWHRIQPRNSLPTSVNPLQCRGNYSATSNDMKLVHWTLHLVQRRGNWRPLIAVPNVTVHQSTASVPIAALLYNGLLLCGFNVQIKG